MPRFKGLERRKRDRTENEIISARGTAITDPEILAQRWNAGLANINRFHRGIAGVISPTPSNMPLNPDIRPEDQPSIPRAHDVVHEAIAREAHININVNINININVNINIIININKAAASNREAAQRRAVEAEEAMLAGEFCANNKVGEGGMEEGGAGAQAPTCVQTSKAEGQVNNLQASIAELQRTLRTDVDETKKKIDNFYGPENSKGETATRMKADIDMKLAAALDFLATLAAPTSRFAERVRTAVAQADLKKVATDVADIRKKMKKEQVKTLSDTLGATKRYITQSSRKSKRGTRGGKAGLEDAGEDFDEEPDEAPVCAVLKAVFQTIIDDKDKWISKSVFVAKGGDRASCFRPESGQEPMQQLAKNAVVRKYLKDINEYMRNTGSKHSHKIADETNPEGKKVVKILKQGFSQDLRTRMTVPDTDWGHKIFSPDVSVIAEGYASVAPTLFCTTEARVYISGEEIMCGFPYNNIPGDDMSAKRHFIEGITADELIKMIEEKKGWLTKVDEGECIMIPSGHLVTNFALQRAVFVRWSVGGDDLDKSRVRDMLVSLMQCYPELQAPNHGLTQFHEWLDNAGW